MIGQARNGQRKPLKSDPLHAVAVAGGSHDSLTAQAQVAHSEFSHIAWLTRKIKTLPADLDQVTVSHNRALRAETGCGRVSGATVIR
jgi:hypothetical protein